MNSEPDKIALLVMFTGRGLPAGTAASLAEGSFLPPVKFEMIISLKKMNLLHDDQFA
jgi:hypothetical protein